MKRIIIFLFAAMASTAVLFVSCKKDDENDDRVLSKDAYYHTIISGDPFYEDREGAKEPKFVNWDSYKGYCFNVEWTPASYDTLQFEYELCWSEEEFESYEKCHSLGRQKNTSYSFMFDKNEFEIDKPYYLTLNTYYKIGQYERRLQTHSEFMIPSFMIQYYYILSRNPYTSEYFGFEFSPNGDVKKLSVTLCDVDDDNQIITKYSEEVFEKPKTRGIKIPNGWSGTIYIQVFTEDGHLKYDGFDKYNPNY